MADNVSSVVNAWIDRGAPSDELPLLAKETGVPVVDLKKEWLRFDKWQRSVQPPHYMSHGTTTQRRARLFKGFTVAIKTSQESNRTRCRHEAFNSAVLFHNARLVQLLDQASADLSVAPDTRVPDGTFGKYKHIAALILKSDFVSDRCTDFYGKKHISISINPESHNLRRMEANLGQLDSQKWTTHQSEIPFRSEISPTDWACLPKIHASMNFRSFLHEISGTGLKPKYFENEFKRFVSSQATVNRRFFSLSETAWLVSACEELRKKQARGSESANISAGSQNVQLDVKSFLGSIGNGAQEKMRGLNVAEAHRLPDYVRCEQLLKHGLPILGEVLEYLADP